MTLKRAGRQKAQLRGWRRLIYGVVLVLEALGLAVGAVFGVELLDPHLLGNVTATKSPIYFWMAHAHPIGFLLAGVAGIGLFAILETLRIHLARRWRVGTPSRRS